MDACHLRSLLSGLQAIRPKDQLGACADRAGLMARSRTTCRLALLLVLALTAFGPMPIEQVCPGDLVLSRDPATREEGYKPVVQWFGASSPRGSAPSARG